MRDRRLQTKLPADLAKTLDPIQLPACVADVMTSKVVTLSPHHSFGEAVSLMANRQFRHFVVVHPDGRIAGVISDRDILRALARTSNWQAKTVEQIMTRAPFTVGPQTPIGDAVSKMIAKRINCLPVIAEDGAVCGIVTSTDLLKSYQKILESLDKFGS
jgi:CBS-domain-containing membrane protein